MSTIPQTYKGIGLEELHELYEKRITWHNEGCRGRHGIVCNVCDRDLKKIVTMLEYFFGEDCYHKRTKFNGKVYDIEFVHMTKVSPSPTRPWEWCGVTMLFQKELAREYKSRKLLSKFSNGQRVLFNYARMHLKGTVVGTTRTQLRVDCDKNGIVYSVYPEEAYRI
jgi:hypothetical protein